MIRCWEKVLRLLQITVERIHLNWWPNGNLKITNDASWLTLTVPYNNVQNTQVQYAKLATGSSEVLITRYIAIQLSEINGSDTIFKVISKEDVLSVNSTSGLTGNSTFCCKWRPGHY